MPKYKVIAGSFRFGRKVSGNPTRSPALHLCRLGAITGVVFGAPMVGVFSTPMIIGIGAFVGLIAGAIISAKVDKM